MSSKLDTIAFANPLFFGTPCIYRSNLCFLYKGGETRFQTPLGGISNERLLESNNSLSKKCLHCP